MVDLAAVKAADAAELAACAVAAAHNTIGLVHDAELLYGLGCWARTLALSVVGVEEAGKAVSFAALAVLGEKRRGQAPVSGLLKTHGIKLVGGLLASVVSVDPPGMAARLSAVSASEATAIVESLSLPALDADQMKRRALYADMDAGGRISEPSDVTKAEAAIQLGYARKAAHSARVFLAPEAQARLANPPPEVTELAAALAYAIAGKGGQPRTPKGAVRVMLRAVRKLHGMG
jgi:AbiV family abortive infection protein